MIRNCKVCYGNIISKDYRESEYMCSNCEFYSFVTQTRLTYNSPLNKEDVFKFVVSETLQVKNYYLIFWVEECQAKVIEDNGGEKKIIHSFSLNELTHELAVQWVNKLKTYVIFQ